MADMTRYKTMITGALIDIEDEDYAYALNKMEWLAVHAESYGVHDDDPIQHIRSLADQLSESSALWNTPEIKREAVDVLRELQEYIKTYVELAA